MKVTVLGLGIMGQGVARTLLREGFDVTVWNRHSDKAVPLAADGATVAATAADAVREANVVVSILFDADSVLSILGEVADEVPGDAIWIQASTIGVDGTARVARLAQTAQIQLVEAMMLGTKTPAETGKLVMLAAGDPVLIDAVKPVLDAMGSKTVNAGERVGNGSALKLAANAWIATITAGIAQSLALAGALGLDPDLFLQAIGGGASDTPYAHQKGANMIAHEYPASFALDGLRKDVGLITETARNAGIDATVLEALSTVYAGASELGHGGDDISAVYEKFAGKKA
ncbi:MAG: 3-hydroxyisobutyrate dehydrogenase [Frondihabitans sp.]|nr:3-hydroxyisobutyrate dehydrogenase [Frondihabitans sp.]